MKAVILAGGLGTRLHPVTRGEIPKPMVPLAGRPVLEWLLLRLREDGVDDICCTLQCLPEQIENYFGDGRRLGLHIEYRTEEKPLGTAGAVRNCLDFIGEEPCLVLSGDGVFDFSLSPLIETHRRAKPAVTMALVPNAAPLAYGLAVTDRDGIVRAFVEKPDWRHVVTDLVNTGIYVLSPAALELVPRDTPFDFARDLFPRLMRECETLMGVPIDGYWRDIGEPASYFRANLDALEGRFRLPHVTAPAAPAARQIREDTRRFSCRMSYATPARAALMRRLSAELMEAGADFSDGLTYRTGGASVRIAPDEHEERLIVESDSLEAAKKTCELIDRLSGK